MIWAGLLARARALRRRRIALASLACATLAIASTVLGATAPAPAAPAPTAPASGLLPDIRIARSALLTLDAIPTDDTVAFRVRRLSDHSIVSSDDVTLSLDGKNESFSRDTAGDYVLPRSDLGSAPRTVQMVIGHNGIREVLAGPVALPQASAGGASLLSRHKQMAWWILNIAIVLIAALALSRRKS